MANEAKAAAAPQTTEQVAEKVFWIRLSRPGGWEPTLPLGNAARVW